MDDINERLNAIEKRLLGIESDLRQIKRSPPGTYSFSDSEDESELQDFQFIGTGSQLESRIGGYGLALIGSVVLLLGIIFLNQWIISLEHPVIASALGYLAISAMLVLSRLSGKSQKFLALMLKLNGLILLYYITLRLHFFSADPLITSAFPVLALLLIIAILQFLIAIREDSEFFAVLGLLFVASTAMISDLTHFMLPMAVLIASASLYILFHKAWWRLYVVSNIICYLLFLLWFFNNPFLGNKFEIITVDGYGYIYLFGCGIIFSLLPLLKGLKDLPENAIRNSLWLNSLGFSFIMLLLVLQFFTENYTTIFALIAIWCLAFSILLKIRTDWKFGSAFYALYGFLSLSIFIYGLVGFPDAYLFLALESLLVLSIALWFRNRLIVIMNGFLFLVLLIGYLTGSKHANEVNFAYALVPLVTARILNWKKQRLEIKTDLLRNFYLFFGFITVLYAIHQAVPGRYVSLSWTLAAVIYFVLSFLIKNVKYRYLAIGTVIVSAFYLFIVDLARMELAFRVLAFMVLAIISIGVSVYYIRHIKSQEEKD